ncbi:conserved exported hypothetical protein [uncultured Gammaproteobacteria bacterium]
MRLTRTLIIALLMLAGVAQAAEEGTIPAEAKPLIGEALRAVVAGKTWRYEIAKPGNPYRGQEMEIAYATDGTFRGRNATIGGEDDGRWKIDQDKLCTLWTHWAPIMVCSRVLEVNGALIRVDPGTGTKVVWVIKEIK